jgi:hypothetical protein
VAYSVRPVETRTKTLSKPDMLKRLMMSGSGVAKQAKSGLHLGKSARMRKVSPANPKGLPSRS